MCNVNNEEECSVDEMDNNAIECPNDDFLTGYLKTIKRIRKVPNNNTIIKRISYKNTASSYFTERKSDNNVDDQIIAINSDYFQNFFKTEVSKKAILIFIIAHEFAHHLDGDTFDKGKSLQDFYLKELIADKDGGYAVGKLTNMDISFFDQSLIKTLGYERHHTPSHPGTKYRVLAAKAGFLEAKLEGKTYLELGQKKYYKTKTNEGVQYKVVSPSGNLIFIFNDDDSFEFGEIDEADNYNGDVVEYEYQKGDDDNYIYLGRYENDEKSDNTGYCVFKSGHAYFGSFKDGLRNGQGRFVWKDGSKYEGEFLDGALNGYGKLYDAYGKLEKQGCWKAYKYVGPTCN